MPDAPSRSRSAGRSGGRSRTSAGASAAGGSRSADAGGETDLFAEAQQANRADGGSLFGADLPPPLTEAPATARRSRSRRARTALSAADDPVAEAGSSPDDAPPAAGGEAHGTKGHRQRLKRRFEAGGPDALADYEFLELVLFRSIPRQDTKPLAKRLISRFGSFWDVIAAPPERLREISGVGDATIFDFRLYRAAVERAARDRVMRREVLSSWEAVVAYCRIAMADEPREHFRILFLDKKNKLVADEVQQRGTVDHTPVYPREVVKRALELNASALILVHNHPSGDPAPSRPDIDMTRQITEVAKPLGIVVHDHIVVGRHGTASFRSLGLI